VRDPTRLAEAISTLARDAHLRSKLGAAARQRVARDFDESKVIDRILTGYAELLRRKELSREMSGQRSQDTIVRAAGPADAPALARLHRSALPEAFLPALGERFMTQLYRALSAHDGAVVLVAENGTGVIGFAAGVVSVRDFYRRFYRRHGVRAAIVAAPRLIRPAVLRRIKETAAYPKQDHGGPDSELLSIAVDTSHRTRGVGKALAEGVISGLETRGAEAVNVVVASDNRPANEFYERMGFRPAGGIAVHQGTPSNVWTITCHSPSPPR
jgi:ribosomal protein S18 acetylase RimI-like enzyme